MMAPFDTGKKNTPTQDDKQEPVQSGITMAAETPPLTSPLKGMGKSTDKNDCTIPKQLAFQFMNGSLGYVWPLPGGRWHAELCGGWWVCMAATKKAAIEGVMKAYQMERERY